MKNIVKMENPTPTYIGDCPNPRDFEKVQRNLEIALKVQEEFSRCEEKQHNQTIKIEGKYS